MNYTIYYFNDDFSRLSIFSENNLFLFCKIEYNKSIIDYKFICFHKNLSIGISKSSGLLNINTNKNLFDDPILELALNFVKDQTKKLNLIPQINISKNNIFLQKIAERCNFKKIPTFGNFRFSIWKYNGG